MSIEVTTAELQRAITEFHKEYLRMTLLLPKVMGEIFGGQITPVKALAVQSIGKQSLQNITTAMDEATFWTKRFNNCLEDPNGRIQEVAPADPD